MNSLPEPPNRKKEISDKRDFLKDIQNMQSKEITQKYDMNRSTVNKRIREMLGDHGVKNYIEAKKYLEGKNLDEVVKDINERLSDQSHITEGTTIIENKHEFLKDIQELQKNEIDHKYGMDAKTINNKIKEMLGEKGVNNYTEAREYLKDKNLEDVVRDIDDRSDEKHDGPSESPSEEKKGEKSENSDQGEIRDEKQTEEKGKNIQDRESVESVEEKPSISTEEITEESKDQPTEEVKEKSDDKEDKPLETDSESKPSEVPKSLGKEFQIKTPVSIGGRITERRKKPKETRDKEGRNKEFILTSGIRQKQTVQRGRKDYDGIDRGSGERKRFDDFMGIDEISNDKFTDVKNPDSVTTYKWKDYEGIDKPREKKGKDYVKLEDNYGEGRYEVDYDGIDKPLEKGGKDYVKLEDNYGEGRYEG